MQISVYLVTKNEEARLPLVLSKASLVADEIVVVDSGSTDGTKEIAERFGARFVFHPWKSIGHQVSFAEGCCSHRWVLRLDGDEVLSDGLVEEILEIKKNPLMDGYKFRIGDMYPGIREPSRWAKHFQLVRLYDREKIRMSGVFGHDDVVFLDKNARVVLLRNFVHHYAFFGIRHMVDKRNEQTDMQVRRAVAEGKQYSPYRMVGTIFFNVLRYFVIKRLFVYGFWGFINSVSIGFSRFLKFAKFYEYEQLQKYDYFGLEKKARLLKESKPTEETGGVPPGKISGRENEERGKDSIP